MSRRSGNRNVKMHHQRTTFTRGSSDEMTCLAAETAQDTADPVQCRGQSERRGRGNKLTVSTCTVVPEANITCF